MDTEVTPQEKSLYDVKVAGLSLKLRSSHDEETVRELAALVDEKIKEAQDLGQNISFQNALLLASLHIAEDLTLLRRLTARKLESLETTAQDLLSNLESSPMSRIRLDN